MLGFIRKLSNVDMMIFVTGLWGSVFRSMGALLRLDPRADVGHLPEAFVRASLFSKSIKKRVPTGLDQRLIKHI